MASRQEADLPIRTKEEQAGNEAPSKNASRKAAKEKEKAEKAAKRQEQERQEKEKAAANDTSKHLYGPLHFDLESSPSTQKIVDLVELCNATEGQDATVDVRVHNARVQSAKLAFLVLRDGAYTIQAVIAEGGLNKISRPMVKWSGGISTESIVRVTGIVKQPIEPVKSASISNFELHVASIYMIAEAAEKLPVQVKDCMRPPPMAEEGSDESEVDSTGLPVVSLNARLNNRVLDVRTAANEAIFQLQSGISNLFIDYMNKHNFKMIHSSKIVGAATEGGSGVFELKYFDTKAYLTQSPQFFKQMAIAMDMKRVYEIGPVFRAENSNTHRHLTEFTGLDFEMVIKNHYHEVLSFGEDLVVFIIRSLQTRPEYKRLTSVVEQVFPGAGNFRLPPEDHPTVRLTFAEGIKLLKESGVEAEELEDLSTAQEKALGKIILERYNSDFFSLDKFPRKIRPFYTAPDPSNPALSKSYDFFMRGQEIMSGAQRIHSYAELCENMRKNDPPLDPESEGFRHYTDAFKFGCPPHGGGGLGLNRILQFYLGLPDIRFTTLFPRDPGRVAP